jgi:outer membrane protein assembly complex protein YaeT
VVLITAVLIGLHTAPAKDYILERVSQMLASQGIDVRARSLDYNLLNLSVRLEEVAVRGRGLPDAPPIAEIAQANANLSLTDLIAGRYVMQEGSLVRPRIHVLIDDEGRSNLPELVGQEPEASASEEAETVVDYLLARLEVTDGHVRYEDRRQQLDVALPVSSMTIEGQRGRAAGSGDSRSMGAAPFASHRMRLSAGGGEIVLHGRTAPIESVVVDLTYDGISVNVQQLELGAVGSTLSLSGNAVDLKDPRYDVSMQARLQVTRLATFAGLEDPQARTELVGGVLSAELNARGPLNAIAARVTVLGEDLRYKSLAGMTLVAEGAYDAGASQAQLAAFNLQSPFGQVRGDGLVALDRNAGGSQESQLNVAISELNTERLTQALELPYSAASRLDGRISARWPLLDYMRAGGDATLTLTPSGGLRRGVVPVTGTLTAKAAPEADVVTVDIGRLQALDAVVDGRVTLTEREQLGGRLRAHADLAGVIAAAEAMLGRPRGSLVGTHVSGALGVDVALGGTVQAPAVNALVESPSLTAGAFSDISLSANADYTPARITLHSADVSWQEARAHASGSVGLTGVQPIALDLIAEQVSLDAALGALGQSVPGKGEVSLRGSASGTVTRPEGTVALGATGLEAYGETIGTLALSGALTGRRAELTSLRVDKPQGEIGDGVMTARGSYDLDARTYDVDVASENLQLTSLVLGDGMPIRGGVDLSARGQGHVDDPTGTASIEITGLRLQEDDFGDVRINAEVGAKRADIKASAGKFNLEANALIGTEAPYATTGEVVIDNLQLETLPLKLETPLTGVVRARASGAADLAQPADGTADLTIEQLDLTWNGQPIEVDGAAMKYQDRQYVVESLVVRAQDSVVKISGNLPLESLPAGRPPVDSADQVSGTSAAVPALTAAPREAVINLDAKLNLATLAAYAPQEAGLQAQGAALLAGTIRSTPEKTLDTRLMLTIDTAAVSAAPLEPGPGLTDIGAKLEVADGGLRIADVHASYGASSLTITGEVPFGWLPASLPVEIARSEGPARLQATVTDFDLATVPGAPEKLAGKVSLRADVEAQSPELVALNGQLTFPDLQLELNSLTLAQQGESTIAVSGGEVSVQQFVLDGSLGRIEASGRVRLVGEQPLDMLASVQVNAAAASTFTDAARFGGQAHVELQAGGTLASPDLRGFAELEDSSVVVREPRIAAQAIGARIDFTPERATLSRFEGSLNGGIISGSGEVAIADGTVSDVTLQVKATDVGLDEPMNLRSLSNADIQVAKKDDEFVVGGEVIIQEAGLTDDLNFDTGILAALGAPPSIDVTEERSPLIERVRFDVKVTTATPIIVDNNLARAEIEADLRLLGTPYETGLSGRMNLAEGSELTLNERRYEVERGVVTFIDDRRIEPSLDLVLNTSARNYEITLEAEGAPGETETTLTSTPELPEPDIISLLVTGRTLEEMRGEELEVAQNQVLSLVGGRIGSSIGGGLQRATGLSTVKVEPNLIADEADPSARLTVGQDLTDDISLVYSTDLVNSSDQMWIAEYDVTRQFATRAVRQADDTYRFDFRHDVRFGGTPEPRRATRREKPRIASVVVTGNTVISEDEVLHEFKLEAGDRYDFFETREGTRRLYERYVDLDRLQARVRLQREERDKEIALTLDADAGPAVTLAFEGFRPSNGLRDEARRIWQRGIFDTQRADDVAGAIMEELVDDRYLGAKVEYDLGPEDPENRRITFRVDPGVQFEAVRLAFEGAQGIPAEELEDVIKEQRLGPKIFTDPSQLTDLLGRLHREQGYLAAELDDVRYELDHTTRQARVVVPVREGPQFKVRNVAFADNRVLSSARLLAEIPLVSGDPYFPATTEASLTRLRQMYWADGYNDARPTYALGIDPEAGLVDVTFTINEGARSIVAGIQVEGNEKTSERLVLEQLEIEPGAPLDLSALTRSRRNLYNTGAYSLVDIRRDEPQAPNPESQPGDEPVRVNVALREVQPWQVRYGALFDTERGPGGILDISNHNSLGSARVIGLRTRYDLQTREARLYVSQPSLRQWPVETIASVYALTDESPLTNVTAPFNIERMGASIQQERKLRDRYVWSYGYRFERSRSYEPEIVPRPPFLNVSPLTTTISRDTRDEPLDAATGAFLSQAFSFSPEFLGSDFRYTKYFGQYFRYIPVEPVRRKRFTNEIVRPRLVYAGGIRIGLANGLAGVDVPLTERFLAGGSTTLRGFAQNSLGPIGPDGVPLGGEAMLVINNELRFPLVGIVDGVVFADIGNVYNRVSDFTLSDLRESGGVGLRLRTPWFLVRVDYGFPLDRRPGESRSRLFFSIGQAY